MSLFCLLGSPGNGQLFIDEGNFDQGIPQELPGEESELEPNSLRKEGLWGTGRPEQVDNVNHTNQRNVSTVQGNDCTVNKKLGATVTSSQSSGDIAVQQFDKTLASQLSGASFSQKQLSCSSVEGSLNQEDTTGTKTTAVEPSVPCIS